MYYSFKQDLKAGEVAEKECVKLLNKKLAGRHDVERIKKKYGDLRVFQNGKKYIVEVKTDFMAVTTGNVAVEESCRGNDSGIFSTKSHFYLYKIFYDDNKFLYALIPTSRLRLMATTSEGQKKTGGDIGSQTIMRLYTLEYFLKQCHVQDLCEIGDGSCVLEYFTAQTDCIKS